MRNCYRIACGASEDANRQAVAMEVTSQGRQRCWMAEGVEIADYQPGWVTTFETRAREAR